MHPVFGSRHGLLLYAAAWIPLGLMLGLMVSVAGHLGPAESVSIAAPVTLIAAAVCLAPWYACRSLPLGSTPVEKLLLYHLIAAMWASGIVLLMARLLVAALAGPLPSLHLAFATVSSVLAGMAALIYLFFVALYYALLAIESSRRAEVLSREAELKALKAQVNPHFLFNSLNSISALTAIDPVKAREMCIRLSEFLRASLRLGERTSIPFAEELALTRSYLDVEQVRFGARLRVKQDLDSVCQECEVPPLLVQPLVENAIKHGIANLADGGEIALSVHPAGKGIQVVIENPFDPDAPAARRNGFGLASVRNRLHARYGPAARLDIRAENNIFQVTLSVPCETRTP